MKRIENMPGIGQSPQVRGAVSHKKKAPGRTPSFLPWPTWLDGYPTKRENDSKFLRKVRIKNKPEGWGFLCESRNHIHIFYFFTWL